MKTAFWFLVTCVIATFGFFAALSMANPWPGFAVAFGVWLIFLWNTTTPKRRR